MVDDILGLVPFPVLADVDLGYTDTMVTLPIGVQARLEIDGDDYRLTIVDPPVL